MNMGALMIDLRGKAALVTGGSRGIGRAIALRLAEAGADVAINYLRQRTAAEETIRLIEKTGQRAVAIRANVGEADNIPGMISEIGAAFGRLDILVSNAASGVLKPALELKEHHWHWTMDINAGTLLPLTQHALPLMEAQGGHIIAVSSLGSVRAIPNYAAVGASKAGLKAVISSRSRASARCAPSPTMPLSGPPRRRWNRSSAISRWSLLRATFTSTPSPPAWSIQTR